MTAIANFPLSACVDALPSPRATAIAVLTRRNVSAWHADEATDYAFFAARDARRLACRDLPVGLECCACGATARRALLVDWLVLHDAPRRNGRGYAREHALAFCHCVGCRDAAHFAAAGIAKSLFVLDKPPMDVRALALHVSYEALCAARHKDTVRFDYLRVLHMHAYAVSSPELLQRDIDWRDLRTEHRRCASPRCAAAQRRSGARHSLQIHMFTLVYGVHGETLICTMVGCPDSEQCLMDVRDEVIAGIARYHAPEDCRVQEIPILGAKPTNVARTCEACGAAAAQRCAGCLAVRYCSAPCQRTDWRAHKVRCRAIQQAVAREEAIARE